MPSAGYPEPATASLLLLELATAYFVSARGAKGVRKTR